MRELLQECSSRTVLDNGLVTPYRRRPSVKETSVLVLLA